MLSSFFFFSIVMSLFSVEMAERISVALEFPDWVIYRSAEKADEIFGPAVQILKKVIVDNVPQASQWAKLVDDNTHPFSRKLPLMDPYYVIFTMLMYLVVLAVAFVVGKILGKHKYKLYGVLHNFFLFALSLYMCVSLGCGARAANYSLWNNAAGTSAAEWRIAKIGWVFYISKIPEWNDTVLMLLKHNYHQVSFLHVYHHMSVFVVWWVCGFIAPSGEIYYSAMVNSGIHVVMYGYYCLTLIFSTGPVRDQLNKIKFIITKGQITQFVFNCFQSGYDLLYVPRSELKQNPFPLQVLFVYMVTLIILFGNFFLQNSRKPRHASGGHGNSSRKTGHGSSSSPKPKKVVEAPNDGFPAGMTKAQKKEALKAQKKKK